MPASWLRALAAAAPGRCQVCGRWPAQPLCSTCCSQFALQHARCSRCALPVPPGVAECGACVRHPPALDACFAAVAYSFPWSNLIAHYKFAGEPGWAGVFARLLGQTPGVQQALDAAQLVLPVPLAPGRLAQRGFNQSLELARLLAPAKLHARLLLRLRETQPQASLPRSQRLANVQGAFAVEPLLASLVRGRRVLLVDDVMTSGASLSACAQALRAAGAAHVAAAVLARTEEPG
jgi:ComF family protein